MSHKGGIAGWETITLRRSATFVLSHRGRKYVGEVLEFDVDEHGRFAEGLTVAFYPLRRDGSYDSRKEVEPESDLWYDLAALAEEPARQIAERAIARRRR